MFTTNCRSSAPSTGEPQTKRGKCGCHLTKRRIGEVLTDTKAVSPSWKTVTIWVIMNMFYEINRCTVKSSLMFSAETSLSYSDNVHVLMIHLTIQKRGMQLKYENKLQNLHSTLLQPAFESPEFSCLDLKAKVLYFEQLASTLHSQIPLCRLSL